MLDGIPELRAAGAADPAAEQTAAADSQAALVSRMVASLSVAALGELQQAVTKRLHPSVTAREERLAELGPLAALLRESGQPLDGPSNDAFVLDLFIASGASDYRGWLVIAREAYDTHKPAAAPDSRRLVERYGHWVWVCRTADGLLPDGRYTGVGRPWRMPPVDDRGRHLYIDDRDERLHYTREDCLAAVRRCALALARRPSSSDYIAWRRGLVRAAPRRDRRRLGLPTYDVIRRRFGSWPRTVERVDVTDAELSAARKARLPAEPPPSPTPGTSPTDRLADLDPAARDRLGLTEATVRRLATSGFDELPLSQAVMLAHELGGSLQWLIGDAVDPGWPCPPDLRLNGRRCAELRHEQGVPERYLCRQLRISPTQWRAACAGGEPELTLGQAKRLAAIFGVAVQALVAP